MIAAAATAVLPSNEDILSRGASAAAREKSSIGIKCWMAPAIAQLKELAPYAVLELVLPGGSLMAILLWLYRRRSEQTVSAPRPAAISPHSRSTNSCATST
jgi:hypothetical protein